MNTTALICEQCGTDYELPTVYLKWAEMQESPTVKLVGRFCYLCRESRIATIRQTLPIESINKLAEKAGDTSQLKSNYHYDRKSYQDGFREGMLEALTIKQLFINETK